MSIVQSHLEKARRELIFSAYQCYSEYQGKIFSIAGGETSYWPNRRSVDENTLFDLGSLTKVVATTSIVAKWVDEKRLTLSESIGKYLPELKNSPYASICFADILSHSSGLAAWKLVCSPLLDWFIRNESTIVERPVGEKAVYSDLGYLLMGLVIERIGGETLETLFRRCVTDSLQMKGIGFGPVLDTNTAATEYLSQHKQLLQGEVFDENCRLLGGKTAHAGLFSSAKSLAPWCREWLNASLNRSNWITEKTAKLFTERSLRSQSESTWGYGWDTKSKAYSSAGEIFSSKSFGHLGFTGTSIWIDPVNEGFAILLTNRVHPIRTDERIKRMRPEVNNSIARNCWGLTIKD